MLFLLAGMRGENSCQKKYVDLLVWSSFEGLLCCSAGELHQHKAFHHGFITLCLVDQFASRDTVDKSAVAVVEA
jgi:hypothetical protein